MLYDLIIIGAGPAGLSAAIYAVRKKLNILVLCNDIGGQVTEAHIIDNYLGLPGLAGVELVEKFYEHAKKLNVEIREGANVENIAKSGADFIIRTNKGEFAAKSVIIATGKKYRPLAVPGGKEYEGKGITYCATCDAPLFGGKTVAVVGAGDAGQDAAWQLTKYASRIYLINRYDDLRGDNIELHEQIESMPKVEVINNAEAIEVKGEKFVSALVVQVNGEDKPREIPVQGIFVEIGSVPASQFLAGMLKLNEQGEIIVDPKTNETSLPGIFGAGDVTDSDFEQIIIAAGEGAKAALAAYEYLKNL